MSRDTFEKLVHVIREIDTIKVGHGGYVPIPIEKPLLITLWYLAKGETLRSVAEKLNLSDSAVLKANEHNIYLLANLVNRYIQWPSERECVDLEQEFVLLSGYPGFNFFFAVNLLAGVEVPEEFCEGRWGIIIKILRIFYVKSQAAIYIISFIVWHIRIIL
ncbi:hypothetical protein QE152_g34322 [Popillia japonica]|uniref:Uncharacterized protein n=1 Tax=Popillia japonica TaxID=7064 RepID=A0AAW1ITW7_POPJA